MRRALLLMGLAALALPLFACGHKGNLKSPAQIELDAQKKARKETKDAAEQQKADQKKQKMQTVQDPQPQDLSYPRTDTGK